MHMAQNYKYDNYRAIEAFKGINGFQNFLAHSAESFTNIKTKKANDGSSVAEFELVLQPYSSLFIVAVSEE